MGRGLIAAVGLTLALVVAGCGSSQSTAPQASASAAYGYLVQYEKNTDKAGQLRSVFGSCTRVGSGKYACRTDSSPGTKFEPTLYYEVDWSDHKGVQRYRATPISQSRYNGLTEGALGVGGS